MENLIFRKNLLGNIVADDFRAAAIFKEYEIDFCCGGKKTLEEACEEIKIDVNDIEKKLMELDYTPVSQGQNFNEWELGFLSDYIVNIHHKYVKASLPDLVFYTQKIATVHAENHPELKEVAELFEQINQELTQHLKKEEEVLFPAIKEALKSDSSAPRDIIHSEIERMNGEHEFAGGAMDKISLITRRYMLPDDACNTYQLTFNLLSQFEDDLHIHVHLENNILFSKALQL
jgi:regulator of cell morphogenesis and NO signaling